MILNLFSFAGLLLSTTCLILVLVIFIYGKTKLHRIWAMFNTAVGLWGLSAFLVGQASNAELALVRWKIAHIGIIFIPIFLFHVSYILCGMKQRRLLFLIYLQGIFFLVLNFLDHYFIKNLRFVFSSFYYLNPGPTYFVFFSIWTMLVLFSLYQLFLLYRKSTGITRNRILYFFAGTGVGFLGGITNFLPVFKIDLYPFGNFTIPLYCIIVSYAVLKYRLMDITVAITRTGIFIAVYTLVLGLPFAVAGWLRDWFIEIFGPNWWTAPLGLMAFLATLGPFIYIYLQRKAEERLLKEQRSYQETLKQASVGMTRIRNLRKLLELITHIVTKTVKISYVGIYLLDREADEFVLQVSRDKGRTPVPKVKMDNPLISWIMLKREPLIYEEVKRQMEDTGDYTFVNLEREMGLLTASVIIPSFLNDKFMGFFVFGDKISGRIYTADDLNVFHVLASQAALAIENAQFYEDTKEMQEQIAQAEKMATIGTMADGLSHQINNRFYALSLIAGDSIDTIKLTDTAKCTPEVKEMIAEINHALERIQANVIQGGEVVQGLLKYSRKGETGFEALDMNTIIDNTLEMVQFKVKLSEIDLVRQFPPDLSKIKGNLTQLVEAFFNFIDNAYDSIVERRNTLKEEGFRGKITISAAPKAGIMEIIIADNGMGIKDDNSKKIFTPFFTTKSSAKKGTGLGLYVVKRIITETHKGRISFDSAYARGARFIIELPLA